MLKKIWSVFLACSILLSVFSPIPAGIQRVQATTVDTDAITPYEEGYVNLYDHPDGAINGSTYIFNPDANFRERMAFDFKRMKDVSHVNTIGFYNIVQMTDSDRDALFDQLEKNEQKAVIRIEYYNGSTFNFDNGDNNHMDAKSVIDHYNTDDVAHGYTALLEYLKSKDRLKDIAYFAINMPVDDGAVADQFKTEAYTDGRANPEWASSQITYADDIIHRLRDILGDSEDAKLYLSIFYGWDFAYNTPSYRGIAHPADGYFFNNYSYPKASPADEHATASDRINQPRLQQGMDRFMAQYPDDLKIIEFGFHTVEFNNYRSTSQTAGLVETLAAKKLALKDTMAFYHTGSTNGKTFNVRGGMYFAQNLYKEEGNPPTLSDWTLDYPITSTMEAEDAKNTLYLDDNETDNNGISSADFSSDDASASGGKMVDLDEGKALEFFNANKGSVLKIRYAAASDATLSLYVNGSFQSKINFAATTGRSDAYVNVNIPLQGSVKLKRNSGDGDVRIDNAYVYPNYESELNTNTNGSVYNDAAASGGNGVSLPTDEGRYLSYSDVKPGSYLAIRYASSTDGQLGLYVNGKFIKTLSYEGTGAMTGSSAYVTKLIPVSIPAGAVVKLNRDNAGDSSMNIDYMQISGGMEAEFAPGIYNGAHGVENSSASSHGVVTDLDTEGASVVFSGVPSGKQLRIRYANSSNQAASMTAYINGTGYPLHFPSTGDSSIFKEVFINATFPDYTSVVIQRNGDNQALGLTLDAITSTTWYEAESAVLNGATVNTDANADNGNQVTLDHVGDFVKFSPVAQGSQLQVRYAASSQSQLSLYINDRKITPIVFPSTGADTTYTTSSVNVDIPQGAAIKLQYDNGDSPTIVDSVSIIEKNEAETANMLGGTKPYADTLASGGMGVDLSQAGDGIEFANVKAGNTVRLNYVSNGDSTLTMYVNGTKVKDVLFPSTGGWKGPYNTLYVGADIPSGATVTFMNVTNSHVRIDNLDMTGVYEAENATAYSANLVQDSEATASNGMSMTGFDAAGSYITFTNKNGASSIVVRYKTVVDSKLSVSVTYRDDVDNANIMKTEDLGVIHFPSTGGSYRTAAFNAYIRDGMQLTLTKKVGDTVDPSLVIDNLAFSDKYEAEAAVLGGSAAANYEGEGSTASNKAQVIATGGTGASLTFDHVKAANRLIIGYTAEADASGPSKYSLYVAKPGEDFVRMQDVTFKPTGSWSGNFAERVVDIDIPYGSDIKLQNDGHGDTAVHFDYIKLTGLYEAENGNFSGNSRTWYHAVNEPKGPSGGYWAWAFADIGDGVEIPGVRGGNQVNVRYSEGEDPSKNGQLGLLINGTYIQDIVMPYTGSWGNYKVVSTDTTVPTGSVVKLKNTKQTDHTAPIDYIEIRDKQHEAENANLYGQAASIPDSSAVYGTAVGGVNMEGDAIEFPGMNAGGSLRVRYKSDSPGTISVYVNGMKKQQLSLAATPSDQYGTAQLNHEIPAHAVIKLQHDQGDSLSESTAFDSVESVGLYAASMKYEAENALRAGAVVVAADEAYSGGWQVSNIPAQGAVEFPEVQTAQAIQVRYASESDGMLALYINHKKKQDITFPASSGDLATKEIKVHVPKGASVEFKNEGSSDSGVALDAIQLTDKWEAEYAILHGVSNDTPPIAPSVQDDSAASNGKSVVNIWAPANGSGSLEFKGVQAGTELTIAYASGDSANRQMTLYINDVKDQSIIFPPYDGGSWGGKYSLVTVAASIPEGATIKIQKDAGDSEVIFDYIQVKGVYEAEDAELLGSAYASSDYDGTTEIASRGLAVGGINTAASGVEFPSVIAGNIMDIRYASQVDGTLYLYVNGDMKKKLAFAATGSYTGSYASISVPVELHNGDRVKLAFEQRQGENPVSVDQIRIHTDSGQVLDDSMEITSANSGIALQVNYSSQTDGQMSLYIGGEFKQKVSFPNTHGGSKATEVHLRIPAGVAVKLQNDGDSDISVNLVDIHVSDKYEAENATLFGQDADGHQTSAFADGPASNGQAVQFIWGEGSYLEFPNVIAGDQLIIGYSSGEAGRHLSYYVNGVKADAGITFANTGGWTGNYQEVTVPAAISEGATVKIQRDAGDSDVIIDYIKVVHTQIVEPEPSVLTHITLQLPSLSMVVGHTQQSVVTATYSNDANVDVTNDATFSSSNTNVATISTTGFITPISAGTTVISAVYNSLNATANLTVLANQVVITPPPTNQNTEDTTKQIVDEKSLKLTSRGNATVNMEKGKKVLFLPASVTSLLQDHGLVIKQENADLEIPKAVLQQLKGLMGAGNQKAGISLSIERIAPQTVASALMNASSTSHSEIISAGEILEFELKVIDEQGHESKLSSFNEPIKLKMNVANGSDKDTVGIYYIDNNGKIVYIGGLVEGNTIRADVTHFSTYAVLSYSKAFTDVPSSHWAAEIVRKMAAKHVIDGVNDHEFAPEKKITRAEFTALLSRALGLTATRSSSFSDVNASDWFAPEIAAANEARIVAGRDSSRFDPQALVTREEMAVMLLRAYQWKTGEELGFTGDSSPFTDTDDISDWAKASILKAYAKGWLSGRESGAFDPKTALSRAESAKVIAVLLQ